MFCPKCGKQMPENCAFCPECGNPVASKPNPTPAPVYVDPGVSAKIKKCLGSGLFLAIAILSTIGVVTINFTYNLSTGDTLGLGFNLFGLLTCIAMWIAYGKSKSENVTDSSGLAFSRGILTAKFVIGWIGVACLAVSIVIFSIMIPVVNIMASEVDAEMEEEIEELFKKHSIDEIDIEKDMDKLLDEIFEDEEFVDEMEKAGIKMDRDDAEEVMEKVGYDFVEGMLEFMEDHSSNFFTAFMNMILIGVLLLLVFTLIYLVLVNALVVGRLKRFAADLCRAVETNNAASLNFKGIKGALIANGIFSLANPVVAASSFVGAAWVGKLKDEFNN